MGDAPFHTTGVSPVEVAYSRPVEAYSPRNIERSDSAARSHNVEESLARLLRLEYQPTASEYRRSRAGRAWYVKTTDPESATTARRCRTSSDRGPRASPSA